MAKTIFMRYLLRFVSLLPLAVFGCEKPESTYDIAAVKNFQLERYLGKWHEVARLPVGFEENMSDVTAFYSPGKNNTVSVTNCGIRAGKSVSSNGVARFKNSPDTGELEVSFFRPFYGDYRIISLDENYTLAAVTSSGKDKLWILSRDKNPPPEKISALLDQLEKWNFDTGKLIFNSEVKR